MIRSNDEMAVRAQEAARGAHKRYEANRRDHDEDGAIIAAEDRAEDFLDSWWWRFLEIEPEAWA